MGVGRKAREREGERDRDDRDTETDTETNRGKMEGKMVIGNGIRIGGKGMGDRIYQTHFMHAWLFFDSVLCSAEASYVSSQAEAVLPFPGSVWG